MNIEEVVRRVVFNEWSVRVTTERRGGKVREGSMGLAKIAVSSYWLAPELRYLVKDAKLQPQAHLLSSRIHDAAEPARVPPMLLSLASSDVALPPVPGSTRHGAAATSDDVVSSAPTSVGYLDAEAEIASDPSCDSLSSTERETLVKARIGQGTYRKSLLALWDNKCAVSGCSVTCVLIASHVKPWVNSTNAERLDPYNGLLLAASIDKLFEQGLISFNDDGSLLLRSLNVEQLASVGLEPGSMLRRTSPRHAPYLASHRRAHGYE